MDNIIKALENYLSRPTDYALLLNGPWGSGKTYFYTNSLAPIINQTPILAGTNTYKAIYVSLYGLETLEEIKNGILMEMFPILKSKLLQVSRTVVNLTGKLLKLQREDIDQALHNALGNEDGKQIIDYSTIVLCIDDFERRGQKLELSTVLGYINTLVQNGVKILLIANEEKDIQSSNLKEIKEKTVGITLEYNPDFNSILSNLIAARYASDKGYLDFLKKNQQYIFGIINDFTKNIRTIIFWLDCYRDIFFYTNNQLLNQQAEVIHQIRAFL